MGFIEDFNNWANPINKSVNNFFGGLGTAAGSGPDSAQNQDDAALRSAFNMGGGSDIGAQQASASSPVPTMNPSASTANSAGANYMGGQQSPSLSDAVKAAMSDALNTPAINPKLMEDAFNGLKSVQPPNYLDLTQNAFKTMQQQVQNMQQQINGGYDQVGTDLKDLYNTNQQAATLGNNNILQQIAQNTGNAIQGSAQGNVNALANLKNAQLATKAAVAAKGGMPMAAGDNVSDPASVAVQGTLANAQQQAAQAGNHAMDLTNLNNEMASALGNQGAIAQQQLQNNRLGYNASVGKYMTDLTNQEAQREMDATKQNYADQMQLRSLLYNMNKDAADLNIKKDQAFIGSRGLPSWLQEEGAGNMDNAKAQASMVNAGNVDPASTALKAYPQFAGAFNNALANGMGLVAGAKPTYADIYKAMRQDPSISGSDLNGNDLINFAQMAAAPKALSDGSDNIYQLMSQFQGQ